MGRGETEINGEKKGGKRKGKKYGKKKGIRGEKGEMGEEKRRKLENGWEGRELPGNEGTPPHLYERPVFLLEALGPTLPVPRPRRRPQQRHRRHRPPRRLLRHCGARKRRWPVRAGMTAPPSWPRAEMTQRGRGEERAPPSWRRARTEAPPSW